MGRLDQQTDGPEVQKAGIVKVRSVLTLYIEKTKVGLKVLKNLLRDTETMHHELGKIHNEYEGYTLEVGNKKVKLAELDKELLGKRTAFEQGLRRIKKQVDDKFEEVSKLERRLKNGLEEIERERAVLKVTKNEVTKERTEYIAAIGNK